jgi:hypothetical protein
MGSHVYNVVKAPIGWSLFCGRERIGGYVSSEAALEAAAAFGAKALREGHSVQINVPGPQRHEADEFASWPARWQIDPK